jgi:spermidine synthase
MSTVPVLLLLSLNAVLFIFSTVRSSEKSGRNETILLSFLFLCSGMPALIYQVVWQRTLFSIYGVNSQSVAVVVSAFMLGLGLGSLLGGKLSARFPQRGILFFGLAELGVAVFGLSSLRIFHWFATFTAGANLPSVILFSLLLLLVPTVLMGATLPLLVEQLVRSSGSVGPSISRLYFVNTLGSAIACYLCAVFLLREFLLSGSVAIAACLNTFVGATAYLYARRPGLQTTTSLADKTAPAPTTPALPLGIGMFLAAFVGWIALGFEIAWFRVFALASADRAPAFALLLATYLAGIAAGSYVAEELTKKWPGYRILWTVGVFLVLAGTISIYLPPLVAWIVSRPLPSSWVISWYTSSSYLALTPAFFLVAALTGSVLPLLCRLSVSPDDQAGRRVSLIYSSNILGSVVGSLGIGFILMQYLGLRQIALLLAAASAICGTLILSFPGQRRARPPLAVYAFPIFAFVAIPLASPLYAMVYERMILRARQEAKVPFAHVVENRNGVISVASYGAIFGGGVYDGYFNTDPTHDTNSIVRTLALAGMHPAPRRILVIGLGSGSWAQVLINHPEALHMDMVEINPGYLQLIQQYPVVSSLLTNRKGQVFVDDGRRWLVAHPKEKYDLIVANTTYHWRDHASSLLSIEYLKLIRTHLNSGGIYYFNTTESDECLATALSVFPYGLRVINFLAVSDSPIRFDTNLWFSTLNRYRIDDRSVFNPLDPVAQKTLIEYHEFAETLNQPPTFFGLENSDSIRNRLGKKRLITDDNMGGEWEPQVVIPWR